MSADHIAPLAAAASERSTFTYTNVPNGIDATRRYVSELIDQHARLEVGPYVQRDNETGAVVGCTRFMSPMWWLGRSEPDEVEIGGTWLATHAQRTGINTEAKLLLLTYAFEELGVERVAICTDASNGRSRAAIERLGARFEGIMYRHRPSSAPGPRALRDSAMYSIVAPEWPPTRDHIAGLLARHPRRVPTSS